MKKLFCLCLTLLLCLFSVLTAFAQSDAPSPAYQTTRQFMNALEENEIKYEYLGYTTEDCDLLTVTLEDDDFNLCFRFYFDDDASLRIRIKKLLAFSCDITDAYAVCNELNESFRYAKFIADPADNTLYLYAEAILDSNADCGAVVLKLLNVLTRIVDSARETLLEMK